MLFPISEELFYLLSFEILDSLLKLIKLLNLSELKVFLYFELFLLLD